MGMVHGHLLQVHPETEIVGRMKGIVGGFATLSGHLKKTLSQFRT
jgi:hypothetical protein